jgi:hypothetical protein
MIPEVSIGCANEFRMEVLPELGTWLVTLCVLIASKPKWMPVFTSAITYEFRYSVVQLLASAGFAAAGWARRTNCSGPVPACHTDSRTRT